MSESASILYCHCAYARVVPPEVKQAVLRKLCEENISFEAVPDLCEMSARRDPALQQVSSRTPLRIAACYPRAVKWLFEAAQAPLSAATTEILNMRVDDAETIIDALLKPLDGSPAKAEPQVVAIESQASP